MHSTSSVLHKPSQHLPKLQNFMATMARDFPAAMALLAEDVVWINQLPGHVPFGGEYHGREGVERYLTLLAETFVLGGYDFDSFEVVENDDTLVLVGVESGGKVLPTGKVFDLPFVWVVKFDEAGRIRFLQEHNDTQAIGNAYLD